MKRSRPAAERLESVSVSPSAQEHAFAEVVEMIQAARGRALTAVNTALVDLYWRVGEYISRKLETAAWGEGVVDELARYIERSQPNIRGFTRRNLFRMRQFFEAYRGDEKVSALLTQLPWTHHLIILGQSKRPEEREFYLRLAIRERWGKRELERQLRAAAFERAVLGPPKVSPAVTQMHPAAVSVLKDSYVVEFLDLPREHSERDLHLGLVNRLKDFLIEMGRDFCFVGSEYPVQVGNRDFALDLLFFQRGINCLCAIELKVGRFEPEHLGKLEFYLEALDRDVRKAHEGPSIGILLCASKDNEVVEYALSRSASPALVAEYQTRLPDKKLLQAKLREFYALTETVTFLGPGEDIDRLRVPESRLVMTPAVEARLNERQRRMMGWLVEGKELTSRQCEAEFGVTRPITSGDFRKLVELGLAEQIGAGRSTRYRLKGVRESSTNRQVDRPNRKPGKGGWRA